MELGSIEAGLAYTEEMGLPELFVIEEQYRKAVMEAELAFVTDLAARIDSDELGGVALVAQDPRAAGAGAQLRGDLEGPREVPRGGGGRAWRPSSKS